ncbi:aldehyde dehydrogenase family protein [Candidatus Parvarchaeota archaeon]|nr:aldehyde dehydrogenase family protein [Candidatus Parvarchaeota archaeon]
MEGIELSEYFSDIHIPGERPKFKVFIDGKWHETKDYIELKSPVNGKVLADIGCVNKDELNRAIDSAYDNKHKIRGMAAIDRIEMINKARLELEKHQEEITEVLVIEAGKAYKSAKGEVTAALERMRLAMADSKKIIGEYIPGDWSSDTAQKIALVVREPVGVVAGISPFNYPVYTSIAKIVPALLAGNSMVLKAPSADPLAFLMCAEVFRRSGVPAGTLQVVTGKGEVTGDSLVKSDKINMISFTGSTEVGKEISSRAGLKKVHLELGGKGTAIVLDDADLDLTARECVKGSIELAGQRCDAISRVLVVEKIYDEFIKLLEKHMDDYVFGDPTKDRNVTVGPVISEHAAERICKMVLDAEDKGARIIRGGKHRKTYYEPTLLVDVPLNADIAVEETFGPVVTVIKVKDMEAAIDIANGSRYGLDSCVFTKDFYSAWEVMKSLQVGNVTLNSAPSHGTAYFPFGGVKDSGAGKEGVGYSIEEMTNLKTIIFNLDPKKLGKTYKGEFKD